MKNSITGFVCGILNGLFGSGGGLVAVPMLEKNGIEPKSAHATSVAIIFFLSVISTVVYAVQGNLNLSSALTFIPFGLAGAFVGGITLKRISNSLLRRIFGIIILISAVRMLLR